MKIAIEIVRPSAKLVTPPEFFEGMIKIAEYFGRLSHKSEDKQTEESASVFLRKWCLDGERKQDRHESILEHIGQISFHMVMSRACSHQLVRHRIGVSYTQESQRYCDYSKPRFGNTLRVILPPSFVPDGVPPEGTLVTAQMDMSNDGVDYQLVYPDGRTDGIGAPGEPFRYWATTIIRSYGRYLWLREQKIPAEDARFVLPNAAKTEIGVTANARQWLHMFDMRCDHHAQWEVRQVMTQALSILAQHAPMLFAKKAKEYAAPTTIGCGCSTSRARSCGASRSAPGL